ncbi:class I tRNA ligase family protein [Nocardiopsis tropica]|nr:class I tRNA ligase family protein [Nocardiopsis tropica]
MTAVDGDQTTGDTYDARALQDKWQARWAAELPFQAEEDPEDTRPRSYIVDMFAYPSGDLHMGHAEAYAIGDVIGRYRFQRGDNVLHPVGWDSFGLPAENAAIKNDSHPAEWTYANIETQAASFRRYGIGVDWSRRLHTSDPEYYKWNQWLFTRFFERGLAYRKDGQVNWCPKDQTVLANEQVVQGRCERCGSDVVRRSLNQWYFKITDYAQRLLDDMDQLDGGRWPDEILAMQRNWIGRSTGADPAGGDTALRRVTHRTIDQITSLVESRRFNVAIARTMELVSATRKAIDSGPGAGDPAVREAAEFVAVALSLFAPYVAEEGWEKLGHVGTVAVGHWPEADPGLLVQETVTCVVQVQSKVRDKLSVAPDIDPAELEKLALASERAQGFIGDKQIRKVIVRAPKLVNIVVG